MGGETFDAKPVHEVTVSDFYIGATEVTQALWTEVMGKGRLRTIFDGESKPATNIKWKDALEFCNTLSEMEGYEKCYSGNKCNFNANGYRLPTEAEWEYAARGGIKSKGFIYSGSNNTEYFARKDDPELYDVGSKIPNELGIYDMTGNAWEWCYDWYDKEFYSISPKDNPTGPEKGSKRVQRGGTLYWNAAKIFDRSKKDPDWRNYEDGFRIVRSAR